MNDILENANLANGFDLTKAPASVDQIGAPVWIVSLIIGLLLCFFGLKLVRALAAISGLLVGLAVGAFAAQAAGLTGGAFVTVVLGCGVVLAVLSAVFYRIGVFLWMLLAGTGESLALIRPSTLNLVFVCLGIGLVIAIITEIFLKPLVIIFTALQGGISAGSSISVLAGLESSIPAVVGISAVLVILGIIVQFMMRSREVGKKERMRAKEYQLNTSRELEVEKARHLLEEEDPNGGENSDEKMDWDNDIESVEEDSGAEGEEL